jgi:hypothetical protein
VKTSLIWGFARIRNIVTSIYFAATLLHIRPWLAWRRSSAARNTRGSEAAATKMRLDRLQEIYPMPLSAIMNTANCSRHDFHFTSEDGLRISWSSWPRQEPVRGVVQIAHGLGEHIGRYAELMSFLHQAGFVVYANDHRGHRRTAGSPAGHQIGIGPGRSGQSSRLFRNPST